MARIETTEENIYEAMNKNPAAWGLVKGSDELDNQPSIIEDERLYHIDDLGGALSLYSERGPAVLLYGKYVTEEVSPGLMAVRNCVHPDLTGRGLLIDKIGRDEWFVMVGSLLNGGETSMVKTQEPNVEQVYEEFGVYPRNLRETGVHFQGILRYPTEDEPYQKEGWHITMVYEPWLKFIPEDDSDIEFLSQVQKQYARDYLLRHDGNLSLVEQMLTPQNITIKTF